MNPFSPKSLGNLMIIEECLCLLYRLETDESRIPAFIGWRRRDGCGSASPVVHMNKPNGCKARLHRDLHTESKCSADISFQVSYYFTQYLIQLLAVLPALPMDFTHQNCHSVGQHFSHNRDTKS